MGTTVTFKRPDEQIIQGYLAEPEHAAGAAAIVVIQEWWGVNEQIRGVADRLASAGYVALVPDLYRGKSTVEAEEAHHLMTGLNFGDAASQDEFFPIANIDRLQDKLREAGVTFDFHRYLARHAFANETAVGTGRIPQTQYDPVWSQQAWDRTFSFFGRWLR
jgi:dienelactone hydrolase